MPRIDSVELTPLAFPLERPFRAAVRRIESTNVLVVEARSDSGHAGTGYAFAFGAQDLAPIAATAQALAPLLAGADAIAPERHWRDMHRALALVGAGGPALAALGAIDIALWDLAGRISGQPLYRMLGGARARIPVYGSGGSLDLAADALAAEGAAFAKAGYGAFKFKLGHGLEEDSRRVRAVREAVGPGMRLIADANQQWTAKQAIHAAQALQAHGLWWLEEPVPAQDIAACAEVRAASPVEIATGETNFGVAEMARLIGARAADILMPNLQRVGGITGWRKVAAAAELAGIPMASHVYAEIGVHLMCGVPNALVLEVLPWWPRLFVEELRIERGEAVPPEAPGIGLTLDREVLRRHHV